MREIVLDTETTGLDPKDGHRVVELAAVELAYGMPTGQALHLHFNPERDMPLEAEAVHGLSISFLETKPVFAALVDQVADFIAGARLVIHNAAFDMKFLNAEFARCGRAALVNEIYCTLIEARKRYPGAPASLDALCRRFDIDLSARVKHGALIDCHLLAKVYLEFIGGKQPDLALGAARSGGGREATPLQRDRPCRAARPERPIDPEEEAAHAALVAKLQNPMWVRAAR